MGGLSQQPTLNNSQIALRLLLMIYGGLALAHAYLAPLTTGPDELAHYEYMNFIATHGRLPLDYEERAAASYKSDQPPLYHLLAAIPAALVDPTGPPYLKRVQDHPRRQLIERTRHAWGLYNTEDELWPYRAEILRWHVGRWLAILMGMATLTVTFFTGRLILGNDWLALSAAAIVGFTPRFALTGSMLNYETTLAFMAALFLCVLARLHYQVRQGLTGHRLGLPAVDVALLGFVAGLAITTKLSGLILPFEIMIVLWLLNRQLGGEWRQWAGHLVIAGLGCLVAISWWFGLVLYQFNTVAEDGWWTGLLRPVIAADASDATTNRLLNLLTGGQAGDATAIENLEAGPPWEWVAIFWRTFWVVGIEGHQPLVPPAVIIAGLVCLVAGSGIYHLLRRPDNQAQHLIIKLLLLHLVCPFILPLMRYAVTFSLADTAQGRHVLFHAAPAAAILLIWGLMAGLRRQAIVRSQPIVADQPVPVGICHQPGVVNDPQPAWVYGVIGLLPLSLLLWSGVQLWYMSWAYHPLLPVRTTSMPVAELIEEPLNPYVTLVGYETEVPNQGQMLRVTLVWQATAISPVDYLTDLTLRDETGEVRSHWLGYPAEGRYPNRAWDVGDWVRDTAWLSLVNLPPGRYQVALNLQPTSLSRPAPVLETARPLTTLTLDRPTPKPSTWQVWQDGQPVTEAPPATFRYRETMVVTLNEAELMPQVIGPAGERVADPVRQLGQTAIFIVGPSWSSGVYHLQGEAMSLPFRVINRWPRQFEEPVMTHRVEANFANQVTLLGYDLPINRAEPGGGIPLTLYWQGLDWIANDYTIFIKPIALADQTAYGGRDRLPQEGYRTLYWAPGEIVTDPFGVPIAPDAPPGIYQLHIGLYPQSGGLPPSLRLIHEGQPTEATSVVIGPLKIGRTPPDFILSEARPQHRVDQPFGEPVSLTLLGYDMTPCQPPCDLDLRLYWQSEAPVPLDYTTFVHLRNEAGETVAQRDQPPLAGAYPTSLWDAGDIIADEIQLPLPADLPPGRYRVVVGMYDFQSQQRLVIPGQPANSLLLTVYEHDPRNGYH